MDPLYKETLSKALSLFLGLAALAITGWGCFGLVSNVTWILTTVPIDGKVLAYERGSAPKTWNPLIEFHTPEGVKISFVSALVITTPDPPRGSMVPVRYFQRNPQDAELALFRFKWAHPVVYTSAGLAVFLVWWRRVSARAAANPKKRRTLDPAPADPPPSRGAGKDAPPVVARPGARQTPAPARPARAAPAPAPAKRAGRQAPAPVADEPWEQALDESPDEDGSNAWERTAIKGEQTIPEDDDAWDRTSVLPGKGKPPRR